MSKPVIVRFIGDAANLTGTVHKVGGSMGGLKSTLLGLGIGSLLFGEAKRATQGWQDHLVVARDTENQIRASGGAAHVTAKQVGDLADSIERKTGKDGDAIQSGANMLLTFHDIRNEVGAGNDIFNQATSVLTDMTAKMNGGKVTNEGMSKSAIQLGKSLNDPIAGMGALRRVGVQFTEQQQAQIKALVQSGDKLGAQKIILRELGSEFGGTARATSTATDMMMVRVHQLEDGLGSKLLPIVNAGAGIFAKHSGAVLGTAAALGSLVGVVKVVSLVQSAMTKGTALNAVVTKAAAVASKAWAAAQWLLNAALSANPIALVILAVAGLIAVIVLAYKHSETFRRIVQGAFRAVTGAASAAWDWIRGHWPLLLAILTGPVGAAVIAIVRNWDRIRSGAAAAWNAVVALARSIPGRIRGAVGNLGSLLYQAGRNVIQGLINGILSMIGNVASAIGNVASKIKGFLPFSPAKEGPLSGSGSPELGGRNIVRQIASGIRSERDRLGGAMGSVLGPGGGRLAAAQAGGGSTINVNVATGADPFQVGREVAWAMRFSGR